MSKRKVEYVTYSRKNYDRFITENKISEKELPYDKYVKNLKICNWMYIEYALRTGLKTTFPYGFGSIAINKKKLKTFKIFEGKKYVNLRIDWNKTKKAGKKIYHTNEHSDGYNFRWLWFNTDAKMHLSELYVFKPGRYASRAINKYIRKSPEYKEMYLEWMKPYYNE